MSGVTDDANSVAELTRALLTSCASKQTAATSTQTVSYLQTIIKAIP